MPTWIYSWWLPVLMLVASNVFMTFAWYGHLKYRSAPLWMAIAVSWGIAFFEYVIQVPANRWGSQRYDPYQLKILQEVITVAVFIGFAMTYLSVRPQWNHVAALACLVAAVVFGFLPSR
ncbi:MAG: DMT family protein [Verrucomicrobia bacterium]|nr:DMT family protein [Verrucomicrobiota bacterium]